MDGLKKAKLEILGEEEILEMKPSNCSLGNWSNGTDPRLECNYLLTAGFPSSIFHSSCGASSSLTDYNEEVVIKEQPPRASALPVYTLDWVSRSDPFFIPATGLDFLTGVQEVLLQETTLDLSSTSDSKFVVKVPKEETLYLGIENSSSLQRALLCSQRGFSMTFLDPSKKEAATFVRRTALANFFTCFRQELTATIPEKRVPIGRIIQDAVISTVSFSVLDEKNEILFKIIGSETSFLRKLNNDVHFKVLDPVNRREGVILHRWDDDYKGFLYQITFPSSNTPPCHKVLLIGAALLLEYAYFKKSLYFCGLV